MPGIGAISGGLDGAAGGACGWLCCDSAGIDPGDPGGATRRLMSPQGRGSTGRYVFRPAPIDR